MVHCTRQHMQRTVQQQPAANLPKPAPADLPAGRETRWASQTAFLWHLRKPTNRPAPRGTRPSLSSSRSRFAALCDVSDGLAADKCSTTYGSVPCKSFQPSTCTPRTLAETLLTVSPESTVPLARLARIFHASICKLPGGRRYVPWPSLEAVTCNCKSAASFLWLAEKQPRFPPIPHCWYSSCFSRLPTKYPAPLTAAPIEDAAGTTVGAAHCPAGS